MPNYLTSNDEEFFNCDWWNGAAARLEAHLPGSVTVSFKAQRRHKKSSKLVIDSYVVNREFIADRIGGFEDFNVMKRTGDKKLCLLYCLWHKRMTAEAMEIAESGDPMAAYLAGMSSGT